MDWISVKDKLPEEHRSVFVYTERDGIVPFVSLIDGEWVSEFMLWSGNPTHWTMIEPPTP